ncbi:MAG: endonuclease MutS2 [Halanaerobiaceae bacterium]
MDENIMEILELDKIKKELKNFASTNIAREIVENLSPVSDIDYVRERLEEVSIAVKLINEFSKPPFGGIRDLRKSLKKVNKGIVLTTEELLDILNTLGAFRSLRSYFNEIINSFDPRIIDNYYKLVIDQGLKIELAERLERELKRCLDEYGDIADSASPKLASIRREISNLANKIHNSMDSIVNSSRYKNMLQDNLVTKRRDRYVVPVKSEYRNAFKGIVHDQSSSGMTLFMEPMAVVKMNNRLSELKSEEEKEIYRILKMLTSYVERDYSLIDKGLRIATILDVVFARAEFSIEIGGIAPELNEEGIVQINQGRHPLLKDDAVPIDIEVGDNFSTLIITGPNTGGKTVALKTVGLFVLMVECGLHLPADRGTQISVFENVFADIGDEQSIEQNLSTFSSHMTRIKNFLRRADKNSLVLMDELGAGTDPREGAALGISIMDRLRKQRAITIVTTHYSQLKNYAFNEKGVENASVEFDIETLKPTYRILMGIPGGSNAFDIAVRLGIPDTIVNKAREMLSEEEVDVENIIFELNQERKEYNRLKEEFAVKEKEAGELKEKYENLLNQLKDEKVRIRRDAREEAAEIVSNARKESKNILKQLKKSEFTSRSDVDRMGNEVNKEFKVVDSIFGEDEQEEKIKITDKNIKIGDEVRIKSVGQRGKVVDIDEDKDEATIQAGIMTVRAKIDDIMKVEMPEEKSENMASKYQLTKSEKASKSLDLRGERYENAQRQLEKYLDDVFLAKLQKVEIIHGKGTGALREAVQEILKNHKHVAEYRMGRPKEGGTGVTIVDIK